MVVEPFSPFTVIEMIRPDTPAHRVREARDGSDPEGQRLRDLSARRRVTTQVALGLSAV